MGPRKWAAPMNADIRAREIVTIVAGPWHVRMKATVPNPAKTVQQRAKEGESGEELQQTHCKRTNNGEDQQQTRETTEVSTDSRGMEPPQTNHSNECTEFSHATDVKR